MAHQLHMTDYDLSRFVDSLVDQYDKDKNGYVNAK